METLFAFLLNSSLGIVLFYLVYWFFFRKETFYIANRWFLISALLASLLVPFFPVHYSVFVEQENNLVINKGLTNTFKNAEIVTSTVRAEIEEFNWGAVMRVIYFVGAGFFLFRLLSQVIILFYLILKYRPKKYQGVRILENHKYSMPFSFFNIVFINPKFHTQENLPEILAHEKVHIRENHWLDLLFIELLTVIFWFNPFIWFFERSIKQNHEYLADKAVLAQGHGVGRYQALLLNQLMGMQIIGITNNLNFALNTNRLKMMTKKKTSAFARVKLMWALPAVALLLFAFAEPNYQLKKANEYDSETLQKKVSEKTVKLAGTVVDENGEPLPGAAIVIIGSWVGTFCDMDGKFNLEVPENDTILISFVGKKTIGDILVGNNSGNKDGVVNNRYKMEDAVSWIFNKNYSGEQLPPPPPPPPPPGEGAYIDYAEYPGGYEARQEYIGKMQQNIAQSKGVKGKAIISFSLDKNGNATDIKVVEKDNNGAAEGAVMIASEMPEWTPAKQHGKAVSVKYLMPVEFK